MSRKFSFSLFLILILLATSGTTRAEMQPARKLRAGLPPYEVLAAVLTTNQTAVASQSVPPAGDAVSPAAADSLATPYLTWLADPDARLREETILTGADRQIYAVRNLGNQLELSQGAVDFGVRYLHTPVLLITGNTDSLAIHLFRMGYEELDPAVRKDLDHLHLPLSSGAMPAAKGKNDQPPPDPAEEERRAIEANVDYQVQQAVARYQDRVKSGRLVVVGGIVDITNAYGRGAGRLLIINVNNVTDLEKLRRLRLMTRLSQATVAAAIGRQRPMAPIPTPPPKPPPKRKRKR